jgi:cation/acetate symporter
MYWKRLTTRGAVVGGFAGLVTAVALTVLGPAIWVKILGFATPVFPYDAPALFSMTLAFAVCWIVSQLDHSIEAAAETERFEAQYIRSQTGIGAEGAASH